MDIFIVVAFLAFNLILGLAHSRQAESIQEYAIGRKDFSTATITAAIVVSWIGGDYLFYMLGQVYQDGLYFAIVMLGASICLFLVGQLAARMGSFLHNVSVAEAFGDLYDKHAQVITAIAGILSVLGVVAIEFQVIGKIITLILDIEGPWITVLAATIVILYSVSGGIRAVTFTDVLQFLTFSTFMPVIALVVWNHLQDPNQVVQLFHTHPNFNPKEVVSWNPRLIDSLLMFVWFAVPGMDPVVFQRISMSRSVLQAKRSFSYAGVISLLASLLIIWLAILLLANDRTLEPHNLVNYIIQNYASVGLKGFIGVGVMALAMSTADSYLNASSVLFANDIIKPLGIAVEYDVRAARIFCGFLGVIALFLSLYANNILELLILSNSFYMPIVTVPLLMAIWGFRTSTKGALLSMASGFITVILWSIFISNASSIVPGMLANLLVLLSSHYLLGESGGWQKVDPYSPLGLARTARKEAWQRRIQVIKDFKLYSCLQQNLPQQEGLWPLFGSYAMVATYGALFAIEPADVKICDAIYKSIVYGGLFTTTAFLTYPIWPPTMKSQRLVALFWPLGIAALLFFAGTLIAIMSHFHPVQMMVLMANLLIAVLLLRWSLALILAAVGGSLALLLFHYYTEGALPWSELVTSQYSLLYGLVLLASVLIALLRGKEAYARLGRKNEVLTRLDQENKENLLQAAAEKHNALQAIHGTGVEKLLTVAKDLRKLPIKEEGTDQLYAIEATLIPIAFQLQSLDTRALDYLRLQIVKLPLQSWCDQIKEAVRQRGVTIPIHCKHNTNIQELGCDPDRLTSLLVKSIATLNSAIESLQSEERLTLLIGIEDTQLSYPLPDVAKGYIKQVPALRIAVTAGDHLPPLAPSYTPHLAGPDYMAPETPQDLEQLTNNRIIKSHYGYAEVKDHTLVYVVPVDIESVRPKDMDKAYMEVGATPERANDHFKNDAGIDAQVQEQTFLAEVGARSEAQLGKVKTALELIKWYHGPKKRHTKEPFYLHPLAVAQIVLDYNTDESTIIGALLHDTVEDTSMLLQHIEAMFGKETAEVVDVVTHLQSIEGSIYKVKLSASENLQMLDLTGNKRGLYVKLADRMHNMRTINGHSRLEKRRLIADETMRFFVPLAERLGLQKTAQEFEELCLEVSSQRGNT